MTRMPYGLKRRGYSSLPPFLHSADAAVAWVDMKWLLEQSDFMEVFSYAHDEDEDPYVSIRERAQDYVAFAKEVYRDGKCRVFRDVLVEGPDRVAVDRLGRYWSRHERQAEVFNQMDSPVRGGPVVLTAEVLPVAIDWAQGLLSYLIWGSAEWEVTLLPDVQVKLLKADGGEKFGVRTFDPPVLGNSGPLTLKWKAS